MQTAKSLDEGLRMVTELPSADIVSDAWNNKLVHLSGPLGTDWVCFC